MNTLTEQSWKSINRAANQFDVSYRAKEDLVHFMQDVVSHVTVAPLEWDEYGYANTPFGMYTLGSWNGTPINLVGESSPRTSVTTLFNGIEFGNVYGNVGMAREACADHYRKRVIKALSIHVD